MITTKENLTKEVAKHSYEEWMKYRNDELKKFIEYLVDKEIELTLYNVMQEFSKRYELENNDPQDQSISQFKKMIKYCKNPLEKKQLERKLNELYKERKK